MNIAVIGTGYVGLVTGTCFSESGNNVICVDNNPDKIETLRAGKIPIYEPGLEEMVVRNTQEERLKFSTDIPGSVEQSEIIFIAVGTPQADDGSADLSSVWKVAEIIGHHLNGYKIVVTKSTVPVGTTDRVREIIRGITSKEFDVISNPEFLKEGTAIEDFMKPDRIVIGGDHPKAIGIMKDMYEPFVRTGKPILTMDIRSSELTKYASNALLATKITFMNEIANLCEKVGADVDMIRQGVGSDSRIGYAFLFPGVGYGGSCFPKDVRALEKTSKEHHYDFKILNAVDQVNTYQKKLMVQKILKHFNNNIQGKTIAIWGLSFKPNTDDMRDAPSIDIINGLLDCGAKIQAFDPAAIDEARKIFEDRIQYFHNDYEALKGADALVVVTEWNEFRRPDYDRMKREMKSPVIFDGRNIYNPVTKRELGFIYYGIGRK